MPQVIASNVSMQKKAMGPAPFGRELPAGLSDDPRWQLVQRIAGSESFARASRLSAFLVYVSYQALAEDGADLNEQSIGEKVFARPVGYDSSEDNIVRAHASRLRQRLESYFAQEGAEEPLRLSIPRGSYAPLFERATRTKDRAPETVQVVSLIKDAGTESSTSGDSAIASRDESEIVAPPPATPLQTRRFRWLLRPALWIPLLAIAVVLAFGFARHALLPLHAEDANTPTHLLWSQMFSKDRNTLIVPADSSLVIFAAMTGHRVSLADYATGRYKATFPCSGPCDQSMIRGIAERRYTSVADLEFAVALARRPESVPSRTQIRYVRDLQLEDFKQANVILAGSLEADPWLELMENQMDFVLQDDRSKSILEVTNQHPRRGEPQSYPYDSSSPHQHGLATVAFLPNHNGSGNVLVVQGFTLADTEAAAEFVTDGKDLNSLLAPILRNRKTLPHFECLLETMEVNGVASHPAILALHVHNE